ncbi:hypothetical protein [Halomarina pelagica]|nr:hypothetical protein [Halomarina sp. BND7]
MTLPGGFEVFLLPGLLLLALLLYGGRILYRELRKGYRNELPEEPNAGE